MRHSQQQIAIQLTWALLLVAAAFGATQALYHVDHSLRQQGNFAFFMAAVVIAAWRSGLLAALSALLLSALVIAWILPPSNSFRIASQQDVIRLILFTGVGLLVSYLSYSRSRAEKSSQESDRRLEFSLGAAGVACWDADIEEGTFWKSHNLPEIFGRTSSDFATTYEGFFAYIHPEDRDFFNLASVVDQGRRHRDYEISHRIFRADGTVRRVSTRGRMYLDENGRVERMVGAVFSLEKTPEKPADQTEENAARLTATLI
jgi:PAS domain-containing protein